ncbi:MAG: nucleoside kinase [Sphaerochaetaceae bacterium]|nr:nucleoside kinase [Sphaerochaetaceae bacterium]
MNINVTVKDLKNNYSGSFSVAQYTEAAEVLKLAGIKICNRYEDNPVIGVCASGIVAPLHRALSSDCTISVIRAFDSEGRRIYRHSLCFLLFYAASEVLKGRTLIIGHSLGDGFYFSCADGKAISEKETSALTSKMLSLVSEAVEIENICLETLTAQKHFEKNGMEDTALLLSQQNTPLVELYRLKDFIDVAYEPLAWNTCLLSVFEIRKYGNGLLLRYPTSSGDLREIREFADRPKLFSVFEEYKNWGKILKVSSCGEINRVLLSPEAPQFIRLCEALQRRKIAEIADGIARKGAQAVFIAGPSSSGKTTFAKRLCEQIMLMDYETIRISLDDYYKRKVDCPKDAAGKPDLECLEALKTDLFRQNMQDLFGGKEVDLPHYSFQKQETFYLNEPVRLTERTVFVIEGIHGLNPEITSCVSEDKIFKIYISALTQLNIDSHNRISTTDNRIIRRIVRDNRTRDTSALETLKMWYSVEDGERKHIFPFQNNADVMFNSALDYEICVLSPFVVPLLREVSPNDGEAYATARRLLQFLEIFNPLPALDVPSDSLLREFIGQSDYED